MKIELVNASKNSTSLCFFLSLIPLSVATVNNSVKVLDGEPRSESEDPNQK